MNLNVHVHVHVAIDNFYQDIAQNFKYMWWSLCQTPKSNPTMFPATCAQHDVVNSSILKNIHLYTSCWNSSGYTGWELHCILTTAGLARGFPKPGRLGGSPGRPGGGMGGCWPNIPKAAAPPRGSPGRPGGRKPGIGGGGKPMERKRERERESTNKIQNM